MTSQTKQQPKQQKDLSYISYSLVNAQYGTPIFKGTLWEGTVFEFLNKIRNDLPTVDICIFHVLPLTEEEFLNLNP